MQDSPVALWGREQRRRGLSDRTVKDQRRVALAFRAWLGRPLATASSEDIEGWLDSRPIGLSSRSTYLKALASFYEFTTRTGVTKTNPVAPIRRPPVPKGLPHPIPQADLDFALSQARPRMRAWLTLAAYQGLRADEIARLRREDLHLDRSDPILVVARGKGAKARTLPLNPCTEAALRGAGLPSVGFVFRRPPDGAPISGQTVSHEVNAFLHGLGIASTCHSGRHYFGTEVYRRTKDIRLVQYLLGHASLQTTQVYTAFDPAGADVVRQLGKDARQETLPLPSPG